MSAGADSQGSVPVAAKTDVGKRRDHNEDALAAELPLLAVADGVGGSAKGEVASSLAVDTLRRQVPTVQRAGTSDEAVTAMERAVLTANRAVHDAQLTDDSLRGMATTITAAVLRDGGEVIVGHVGDSRMYVVSAAGARLVTDDHSVVAELVRAGRIDPTEAATHPQRNVITRALGPEPDVSVDAFVLHVGPGDWLLVCSDGLTEHVSDEELARAVVESARSSPDAALSRLVDQANARGGTDNISVVIAQPVPSDVSGELTVESLHAAAMTAAVPMPAPADAPAEDSGPLPAVRAHATSDDLPPMQPLERAHEHDHGPYRDRHEQSARRMRTVLLLVLITALAAGAGAFVWSQSYFLVERSDGRVGIDRGFPLAGLSTPHRDSDVEAEDLSPADRERLVDSHRLLSRDDAERVLADLPDRVERDEA